MTSALEPSPVRCRTALAAMPFVTDGEGAGLSLELPDGRRTRLLLHVADCWADLTAEPGGQAVRTSLWDALALNAGASGLAKLILRPGDSTMALRADVSLAADEDPSTRLAAACDDLRRLAEAFERHSGSQKVDAGVPCAPGAPVTAAPDRQSGVDIAALLTEAGWPFVERASNRLAVDLGLPDQYQQAFITSGTGGRHRVRATLAVVGSPTAATRNALGVLLLTVSAAVRMARGSRTDEGGESTLLLETPLSDAPDAAEIDAALGAVAMACQMAGREARTLIDERIARAYLAARGWGWAA